MSGITTREIEGFDGRPATVRSGQLGLIDMGTGADDSKASPALVSLAKAIKAGSLNDVKSVLQSNSDLDLNQEVALNTVGPNNWISSTNETPLFSAIEAEENSEELVQLLLEHKADPNYVTHNATALCCACLQGKVDIVKVLLEHRADPTIVSTLNPNTNLNALGQAVTGIGDAASKEELIELLCNEGLSPNDVGVANKTALNCCRADLNVVRALLEAKADPSLDNLAESPLSPHIHEMVPEEKGVAIIRELVQAGARVNDADSKGRTPLHIAAAVVRPRIAKVLLELGADKNAKDSAGRTAHDVAKAAADCHSDDLDVLGFLSILETRTDDERREIVELTKL